MSENKNENTAAEGKVTLNDIKPERKEDFTLLCEEGKMTVQEGIDFINDTKELQKEILDICMRMDTQKKNLFRSAFIQQASLFGAILSAKDPQLTIEYLDMSKKFVTDFTLQILQRVPRAREVYMEKGGSA